MAITKNPTHIHNMWKEVLTALANVAMTLQHGSLK